MNIVIMKVDASRASDDYIKKLEEQYKDAFAPAKVIVIPDHIDISILPIIK